MLRDFFYDVTTRDVSYINKIELFTRRSDWRYYYATANEQFSQSIRYGWGSCYFGSFFLYEYK